MPLVTNNIEEAHIAYGALETRAVSAEQRADVLQATVDRLTAMQPISATLANQLAQHTVDQEAANAQLRAQQVAQVSPDVPVDRFIASLGLAAAIGEASMPDRAVASIAAAVQGYLMLSPGPGGTPIVPALRFYQPEFGAPGSAGSVSFEIAKTPPSSGAAAAPNLYAVLQHKQSVFTDPVWSRFVTATQPPVQPAQQIVVEIAKVFASTGAWDFSFLVQEASAIAAFETGLVSLLAGAVSPQRAASYSAAVAALTALVRALDPQVKAVPVAGDIFALAAALDASTRIAETLRP